MSHDHALAQAILAGEAAWPEDETRFFQELDACPSCSTAEDPLQAALDRLPTPPLPADLHEATRKAVHAAAAGPVRRRPSWTAWGAAVALAAGILFALLPEPPPPAPDLQGMTARGGAPRQPILDLRLARLRSGVVARHPTGASAQPGDVLYFRAETDSPVNAVLLRHDPAGSRRIWSGRLAGGVNELHSGPDRLVWRVEANEGPGTFELRLDDGKPDNQPLCAHDRGPACAAVAVPVEEPPDAAKGVETP
jgi:hypothetical protein